MGQKIDLEKTIEEIKKHRDKITTRERSEAIENLERFTDEIYALAHDHIIELLEVLAENGKI